MPQIGMDDTVPLVLCAISNVSTEAQTLKILFDCTLVVISAAISLIFLGGLVSVREGTVISSLLIGMVVGVLTRVFGKKRRKKSE